MNNIFAYIKLSTDLGSYISFQFSACSWCNITARSTAKIINYRKICIKKSNIRVNSNN